MTARVGTWRSCPILLMDDGSAVLANRSPGEAPWCTAGHVDIGATTGDGGDPCRAASNPILMTESVLFPPMGFYCYGNRSEPGTPESELPSPKLPGLELPGPKLPREWPR